jgi:hypothetical protein
MGMTAMAGALQALVQAALGGRLFHLGLDLTE